MRAHALTCTFSNNEPEPQAKSKTLANLVRCPVLGSLTIQRVTIADKNIRNLLRRIKFSRFFARACGKLTYQVFIGVA